MSKYVKNLVSDDIKKRLQNVNDALLVNMVGMNSSSTYTLRKELRAKKINILVVKNSMAARATAGTPLARLFDGVGGSAAICWGSEDIVALAKSITEILKSEKFPAFQPRGGVMDGEQISADQIAEVAKWPSRTEQLSLLLGPDPLGRLAIERPVDRDRRGVGQPDCREGQGRRGRGRRARGAGAAAAGRRAGGRCRTSGGDPAGAPAEGTPAA